MFKRKNCAFTNNFNRVIDKSIYIQVFLKGIWIIGKYDDAVTMAWIIYVINSTNISFKNDQLYVIKMTIKYIYIDVGIINIICYIILKNLVIEILDYWRGFAITILPVAWLIKCVFNFRNTGNQWLYYKTMKTEGSSYNRNNSLT